MDTNPTEINLNQLLHVYLAIRGSNVTWVCDGDSAAIRIERITWTYIISPPNRIIWPTATSGYNRCISTYIDSFIRSIYPGTNTGSTSAKHTSIKTMSSYGFNLTSRYLYNSTGTISSCANSGSTYTSFGYNSTSFYGDISTFSVEQRAYSCDTVTILF